MGDRSAAAAREMRSTSVVERLAVAFNPQNRQTQ
jgi:hypothetical protein